MYGGYQLDSLICPQGNVSKVGWFMPELLAPHNPFLPGIHRSLGTIGKV